MIVYMRYTDPKGQSHVSQHSVWDHDRFATARYAEYKKDGGKAVEISEADYRKEKWGKGG